MTNRQFEFYRELLKTAEDCYRRLLLPATESATLQQLKEQADEEAIQVFAPEPPRASAGGARRPASHHGNRPGFSAPDARSPVVDGTGKFVESRTILSHTAAERRRRRRGHPPRPDRAAQGPV